MTIQISKLTLNSPLIIGSYDFNISSDNFEAIYKTCKDSIGAIVTKTTTMEKREGYKMPQVSSFGKDSFSLLVASGMANPGIETMCSELKIFKQKYPKKKIIGSIASISSPSMKKIIDELYAMSMRYLIAGADALELNLSCPHSSEDKEKTIVIAQDSKKVYKIIKELKSRLNKKGFKDAVLIPKLTGWNCDIIEISKSAEKAGADALVISNIFPGTGFYTGIVKNRFFNYNIGDHLLGNEKGGYTGKALHSAVLLMVESVKKHVNIPIIATGGCASDLDSFVQTFMAGATAIESVTPFYVHDKKSLKNISKTKGLIDSLVSYLKKNNIPDINQLYSTSHKNA